jgi:hypothetical protein
MASISQAFGSNRRSATGSALAALTVGAALISFACASGEEGSEGPYGFGGAAGGPPLVSSRTLSGTVTLSAAWPNGSSGTTSYRSSAVQYVDCLWDLRGATSWLSVSAGDAAGLQAAHVRLEGVNAKFTGTRTFFAGLDDDLEVVFRFEGKQGQRFEYINDTTTEHATVCSLEVDSFEPMFSGHLACRDLIATSLSADYQPLEIPAASVTLAFECPLEVLEPAPDPVPSTGGQPGTGGGGGTGGGSGEASCRGLARPCALLSDVNCSLALGCSTSGTCGGFASSCYSRYSSYSCDSQDGCYWSSSSSQCSGSARSCRTYATSTSCVFQNGCSWTSTCEGVPWSCSSLPTELDCNLQPGCFWGTD